MSVAYDIVLKDNKKVCRNDICFGAMNSLPWSRNMADTSTRSNNSETPDVCARMRTSDMAMIQYHPEPYFCYNFWSHPEGQATREYHYTEEENALPNRSQRDAAMRKRALNNYFTEMKKLVEDVPMLKNCVTVHPLLKITRTHIKDFPADKIILATFLMRNLAQYDFACTYLKLRSEGYRPRVAALFSQIVRYQMGGLHNGSITGGQQGEASWIFSRWFGEQAAIRYLKQEPEADQCWIQSPWVEQSCGYKRDSHLSREHSQFITPARPGANRIYRTLNMAMCIPGDKSLNWGRECTNTSRDGNPFSYSDNIGLEGLRTLIDELCEKAEIEGKL